MKLNQPSVGRRQFGVTTLAITLMLLAILTVAALFAASFGIFEQRSAASEYRHKLAFQAAEAGLNQGGEFVKANVATMISGDTGGWFEPGKTRWQPCSDTKPATMVVDPCQSEPNASRRALMYRYVGTDNTGVLPLSEMFPAQQTFTSAGGTGDAGSKFATSYNAYATLCRLDNTVSPAVCSLNPVRDGSLTLSLVSRGQLTDESADAIVKETFGTYRSIGRGPDAPLIAAASIGLGNAQIVPNPDAGDPDYSGGSTGNALSVWAKGDADVSSASFATCQLNDWMDNYGVNAPPTAQQRADGVCFTCSCGGLCPEPNNALLSGAATGCAGGTSRGENYDVLDVDGKSDASPPMLDSTYFPSDLFAYTFGIPSSAADDYLESQATNVNDCSTELTTSSAGLYWYSNPKVSGASPPLPDCVIKGSVGSLKNPVVLVSDGPVDLSKGTVVFYGVIYIRSKAGTGTLFKATGSPQIYGSVVLEGDAKMSGTPMLIYNKNVIQNILNGPAFLHLAPVAGSWSDDVPR